MAHQSKFVSVNLNKSYGQATSSSTSVHGRPRPGSAGGGGSGGMVVLSRVRSSVSSSAKAAQKLAVPPPLNLPSLRREHERLDPASSGSAASHGSPRLGSRTGSSVLGWSKPSIPPTSPSVPEKDGSIRGQAQLGRSAITSDGHAGNPYMPPGARPGGQPHNVASAKGFLEKAVILKGEDFPSLRATFSSVPKQREALKQKQKQRQGMEEQSNQREVSDLRAPLQMRPQIRSSRLITDNVADGDGVSIQLVGSPDNLQKQGKHLPAPLPQVRLHHTSDWTDDERDTGLCIPERERDYGFSRSQSVQIHDVYDDRILQDTGAGSPWSRDFFKGGSLGRDLHDATNEKHEFGSSRFSMNPRDRPNANASGVNRDRHNVRPSSGNREMNADGINAHSFYGENFGDRFSKRSQDYRHGRTELGSLESSRIDNKATAESFSGKSAEKNVHNHQNGYPSSWSKESSFQNNTLLKGQVLTNNKTTSLSDPIPYFGREKWSSSSGGKQFLEDSEFDSKDPFSGSMKAMNAKVFKKVPEKQVDLHDPVRASYEAELERTLMLQEQERQRILEEQSRVLELAQKEEEEKERLARENEERRRLLEEEARELALREEQEKLEAARRAEEQRIAREEEKRRYQMEEERRKESARKKLLELEARIARRQAEGKDNRVPSFSNEQIPEFCKEKDIPLVTEDGGWEDGERMVERITGSGISDSSSVDRFLELGSRSQFPRDSFPSFVDRGKYSYGDAIIPSLNEDNTYHNSRQDVFGYKRGFPKKEFHGGAEKMPSRLSSKEAMMEPSQMPEEFREHRKQRWNPNKGHDYLKRNNDVDESNDGVNFGDVRMMQGNSHGSSHAQYCGLSSDYSVDDFSSFTRSSQLPRQPHVPPPPYVAPLHRNSFRGTTERASSSGFIDNDSHYSHASIYDHRIMPTGNDGLLQESRQQTQKTASFEGNAINLEQESEKMSPRCGSQLSLSVSSPPTSPALLLHHEMDVSRDSPPLPASADGDHTIISDSEHIVFPLEGGSMDRMMTSSSISPEVDDEWPLETNEEILENECDEFRDIAEAHEADNSNHHQVHDMEDLQSDVQTTGNMEQVILGFNEGVEIKLPNIDTFEISSSNSEKEFKIHGIPVGCLEELITNGEMTARKGTADSSLTNISEMEQALHSLSLDPAGESDYSANSIGASQSSRLPDQPMILATSLSMPPSTTDAPSLSFPSIVSQVEAPVSLQFGLFSGPPLIPSPIQAIQIGSIQMPIHGYTHTSPSLPQVNSFHSPLFQFGQLRYAPTLSPSTLPPAPHGTSIIQPPVPSPYSFNQNPAGGLSNQATQNISQMTKRDGKFSSSSDKQIYHVQNIAEPSPGIFAAGQLNPLLEAGKHASIASQNGTNACFMGDKKGTNDSASHADSHVYDDTTEKRNYQGYGRRREPQPQQHGEFHSSRYISGRKAPLGTLAEARRKRYAHSVRTPAPALFPDMDELQGDLSSFLRRSKRNTRRTEFRVRDNIQRKKVQSIESLNNVGLDVNSVATGITIRNFSKKDEALNKSTKITNQPNGFNSSASTSQAVSSDRKADKVSSNEFLSKNTNIDKSHAGKGNAYANETIEDDGDAPLLSGVVRVFKQTGIEIPSNEDDFIEVRSKRQMLNDRREQKAKENKSKARVQKAPAKHSSTLQSNASKANSNKIVESSLGDTTNIACSNPLVAGGKGSTKLEASFAFTASMSSQTLPPIGTPSVNIISEKRLNKLKPSQVISAPAVSDSESIPVLGPLENKNDDYSPMPLNSWDSENQVIDLTQTQLDEAMKSAHFGSQLASSIVLEPPKSVASAVTPESTYPSCATPISSLIAGEKIQFGAVILPNILPPVSRVISKGPGPPDSSISDVSKDQNLMNNNHAMFLVQEKCSSQPSANLKDAEAEAEAAASAIAVAAITSDEIIGPAIGPSDTKTYSSDGTALTSRGVTANQDITVQSSSEESLTVALPADLSVDTPLSVWSALQSPQASMSMLSQFSGAPPSHFPSFEMNRIVDGCLFSCGSNDESAGSQGHSQNATLGSSTLGAWPQYHSSFDPFYRPPAGYNGTFISPGGISGVQCPPHMVVYNHFPPVGQFGQIGLGYMGTAYIPAGKQPEWTQNQASSNASDNEGDPRNHNTISGQGTPTTAPSTVHNLAPGSSLMVASPLTMFDMNPFQPTANIPLRAWSHVPPPLHSVPLSMPLQQQKQPPLLDSRIPLQFGRTGDTSMGNNKSDVSHTSPSVEVIGTISMPNSAAPNMSGEFVSTKHPTSFTANNESVGPSEIAINVNEKQGTSTAARALGTIVNDGGRISASSSRPSGQMTDVPSKTQPPTVPGGNHLHAAGYGDQHRGIVNRAGSGSEWHHRRFQVKKQGSSADKNAAPKMKQIYVAKPSSGATSNQGQMKI
ncbi:uncharacterized protein LOC122016583 isoform X1 [Zingiber officinale]|uniref:Uncharacterized protein n=1 Tax=Zingiber officinale TaxID=94328 RepID=A0A8J5FBC6_ZINOF|nr:uncharacterized protein LOC122016583 isoform X1 [Zingiber officinale]KAG6484102.1 hypothetical protein ZIOFF_060896 [Zingiber officinale]